MEDMDIMQLSNFHQLDAQQEVTTGCLQKCWTNDSGVQVCGTICQEEPNRGKIGSGGVGISFPLGGR